MAPKTPDTFAGLGREPSEGAPRKWASMSDIDQSVIDQIVAEYINRGYPESDDPIDDARRLLELALALPGATSNRLDMLPMSGPPSLKKLITAAAEYLHTVNPSLTLNDWWNIYAGILCKRYGGNFVRIRKRPKLGKLIDAVSMGLDEWQSKYGMSRAHYFRLRKEAVTRRQREAKKNRCQ